MMSIEMDRGADALLQAARETSLEGPYEQYGAEIQGDGESSLSEIEDEDEEQEGDGDLSEDLSNNSGEENDSEAETERLEESPHKPRPHQDVVLSSNNNQTYERSPSKLQNQITADDPDDDEDDEPLSEGDLSSNESPDSPGFAQDEVDAAPTTANTSLDDATIENKNILAIKEADTRKRKRSIFGSSAIDDPDEPLRKRTGSVMTAGDDYAIEDDTNPDDEVDTSNSINGDMSGDEGGALQEETLPKGPIEPTTAKEDLPELPETPNSPKRRGRKKKKTSENGIGAIEDGPDVVMDGDAPNGDDEPQNADEETVENEGDDETEIAQKNEEELERKRVALDQLGIIEKQFATFRERLYEERLDQLNREEAMLRQDKPTHPDYLAMMQCIEARRAERVRVADKIHEYGIQTLKNYAVARRSQILVQYQQEVREIRETELEQLGEQWYKIQHDRRSYAGSIPDYALKFPKDRSQQVRNQVAYSNEVSILAGVAKYVGFPAAPPMAAATAAELEEDLERMGRKHVPQQSTALPLQELAALRAASSTSRFKPAEEQFIEQTPWANPQHPSHAHLLQRQTSAQQTPRTTSPFSQVQVQPRRHSHQQSSGPATGTFSNSAPPLLHHTNGLTMSTGRVSPHNPFGNSNHHTIAPSPLGSRQPSLSPQQTRPPLVLPDQHVIQEVQKSNGIQSSSLGELPDVPRDFPHEVRREQAAAVRL